MLEITLENALVGLVLVFVDIVIAIGLLVVMDEPLGGFEELSLVLVTDIYIYQCYLKGQ